MNKKTWLIILIIVVLLVIFGLTRDGGEPVSEEPIKVGFMAPLTGQVAFVGENALAGAEIAAEEINSQGGINGRTLELVVEDDQCDAATGVNAATKLVNVDKVTAVVGSVCSPVVLSVAPVFEEAGVVDVSYCSSAADISKAGDYIFRTIPSDLFQAEFLVNYAYDDLGSRKVAILYLNNDWGVGLSEKVAELFVEKGGEVVFSEKHDVASTDLRSQITKVKNSDADALYFFSITDSSVAGLKQIKEMGLTLPIIGGNPWSDTKIWTEVGEIGDGAVYPSVATNSTEEFAQRMAEKISGGPIIYCANYAHDAVQVIAEAMKKVGTDSKEIKEELYQIQLEDGVSQSVLEFDENGDPVGASYVLNIIEEGKPTRLE